MKFYFGKHLVLTGSSLVQSQFGYNFSFLNYVTKMHINGTYKGASSPSPASLLLPSQLDHDHPLHPGNMSSLIRLVSAALEKPQAPCGGEGPERERHLSQRGQTEVVGVQLRGKNLTAVHRENVEMVQEEREPTHSRLIHSTFQPFDETSTP